MRKSKMKKRLKELSKKLQEASPRGETQGNHPGLNRKFAKLNKVLTGINYINNVKKRVNDDPDLTWFGAWKDELKKLITKN